MKNKSCPYGSPKKQMKHEMKEKKLINKEKKIVGKLDNMHKKIKGK
jgi:hypothetical protein